jgi:hypothetical protein
MTLVALSFGAPGFVWAGLGLATAPLILHLLFRQRYRVMDWAAMKWLLEALKKNYRRVRLEQWLLLAVRMLVIFLTALAMAQPALEAARAVFFADRAVTHNVIVFDNSASMHYVSAAQSWYDRAKGFAQAILDDSKTGDLASVVVMGTPSSVLVGDPSPYLDAVGAEIEGLRPQHAVAQLEPALNHVLEILKQSRATRRRVWFVTDLQRTTWVGGSSADSAEIGRKLRAIAESARCAVLDPSGPDSPNQAVLQLEQVEPIAVVGRPTVLRATLANFAAEPRDDFAVELLVDGQIEGSQRVSLPPHEQRVVHFAVAFTSPGFHALEVRLPDDPLRLDNRRWLEVAARQSLAVLVIDGQPTGEPFRSETDYLRVALSPSADESQPSLIRCEARQESELLEIQFDDWDLVVVCNVAQPTPTEANLLRNYVRRGGGVLFYLGSQTNLSAFNLALFQEGKGLLPAALTGFVGQSQTAPTGTESFFSFDPRNYAHPIVAAFKNAEQAGLLTTKVFRFVKAELPPDSAAEIALAYQTGDPAVIVSPHGAGRVGLVTTSADLDWNTWAVSPSYVPVIHELARYLVSGRLRTPPTLAGETITLPVWKATAAVTASVTPPGSDRNATPVRLLEQDGAACLSYSETDLSGIYEAHIGAPIDEKRYLAVNTWPEESDLSKLTADDLRELYPGADLVVLDHYESAPATAYVNQESAGELHRPILHLVLMLLLAELFLAWKFAHHA